MDSDCLCVDRGGSLHPVAGSHQGEIVSHRKTAYCDHLRRGDSRFGCLPCFLYIFTKRPCFSWYRPTAPCGRASPCWRQFRCCCCTTASGDTRASGSSGDTISSIPSTSSCCISSGFWHGEAHLRFKIKPGRAALCRVLPYKCGLIRSSRGRTSAPGQT